MSRTLNFSSPRYLLCTLLLSGACGNLDGTTDESPMQLAQEASPVEERQGALLPLATQVVPDFDVDHELDTVSPADLGLAPRPMAPVQLNPPNTNGVKFVWGAMGDSYASGEGNPERGISDPKQVENFSGLRWGNDASIWVPLPNATLAADVTTCHRSDESGVAKAHRRLRSAYPTVDFKLGFVACSGATTESLRQAGHDGPAMVSAALLGEQRVTQPSQISRIKQHKETNDGQLDAVYMSIGGNDFGFPDLVRDCTQPVSNCLDRWQGPDGEAAKQLDDLVDSYNKLDDAIRGELGSVPILIHQLPNPLHDGSGTPAVCLGDDYNAHAEVGFGRFDDFLQDNVSGGEAAFAFAVPEALNQVMRTAAGVHGWRAIAPAAFEGHGICTRRPFANLNSDALRLQGRDSPNTAFFLISNGILHPNNAGYDAYADRIVSAVGDLVDRKVRDQLLPPGRPQIAAAIRNGAITVKWNERAAGENRYEIEVTPVRAQDVSALLRPSSARSLPWPSSEDALGPPPGYIDVLPANAQEYVQVPIAAGLFRYRVRACNTALGFPSCGPYSADVVGANFPPANPGGLSITRLTSAGQTGARYTWTRQPDALEYVLRIATPAGTQEEIRTRNTPIPVADPHAGPAQLAACNRIGCTNYGPVVPMP